MKTINLETIHRDLELLKKAVDEIKKKVIRTDEIMDKSDLLALEEYKNEKDEGNLISHEEVKKELKL